MKVPTIDMLRKQGYKIRLFYKRHCVTYNMNISFERTRKGGSSCYILPKGGTTVLQLTKDDKSVCIEHICTSNKTFDKKKNTRIAIGKALYLLKL